MAIAKAAARHNNMKLYEYIKFLGYQSAKSERYVLPCPSFNLINGGKHGGNKLAMQ